MSPVEGNPFGTTLISVGVPARAEVKGRDFASPYAKYSNVPQYSVLSPTLRCIKTEALGVDFAAVDGFDTINSSCALILIFGFPHPSRPH
jgi:hypothetical protein